MEQLIPVVNKLQDVFNTIGETQIDLPQIVVVGSQSSGKSSVIENIVTREFLPRGTDIVTRCPLILQLVNISQDSDQEWAEFFHAKDKKYFDFNDIKNEIEAQTLRLAGPNKAISRVPIQLKIYSNKVVNLTLVDLPGITKIPIGDQPQDIEQQIKDLITEYTLNPNSIILAVTPANMDLVNSEALKFAKEVDPKGIRTLGVLTKLDLMDSGTHALDILNNQGPYLLHLGFIGIVCRSQRAIMEKKSIQSALKDEEIYFKSHPIYKSIAHRCGSQYLSKILNYILMNHIKDKLPDLKTKINTILNELNQRLICLGGDPYFQGKTHRGSLLLKMLTQYSNDFNDYIDGTSKRVFTSELRGGAKLSHIFHHTYHSVLNTYDINEGLSLSEGTRPSLFVPEVSFELLVKKQIEKLEAPSLDCVSQAYEELLSLFPYCRTDELKRYPVLYERILSVSQSLVKERLQPTKDMIYNLIQIELAYVNTNHPDFIKAGSAISALNKIYEKKRKDWSRMKERKNSSSSLKDDIPNYSTATEQLSPDDVPRIAISVPSGSVMATQQSNNNGLLNFLFRGSSPASTLSSSTNSSSKKEERTGKLVPTLPIANNTKLPNGVKANHVKKENMIDIEEPLHDFGLSQSAASLTLDAHLYMSEKEEMETHLILSLIQSYYNVVKKNICDSVPKSIMYFLVNSIKASLHNRLVSELYKEELFSGLLKEDENIEKERIRIKSYYEVYSKAANIISEVKEIDIQL